MFLSKNMVNAIKISTDSTGEDVVEKARRQKGLEKPEKWKVDGVVIQQYFQRMVPRISCSDIKIKTPGIAHQVNCER